MQEIFGTPDIDTGLAIHDGYLYFSSMTTIYAVRLDDNLVPSGSAEVVVGELPQSASGHRTKPITFDPAGNLYTQVGSPSNTCQTESGTPGSPGLAPCTQLDEHGGVFRFSAAARNQNHARDGYRYSTGHRNVVALEWNAAAGALYLAMHDRDGLSRLWPEHYTEADDIELPAEEFHRLDEGDDLGWPYTYWDPIRNERMVMPEYGGDGETPAEAGLYKDPLIGFPGHWAPDDIVFYTGEQFPERYRNGAFLAFHGPVSPRRADPGAGVAAPGGFRTGKGYSVVFVPMDAAGEITGDWEFFADDFERLAEGTDSTEIGRPAVVWPSGRRVHSTSSMHADGRIWIVSYGG